MLAEPFCRLIKPTDVVNEMQHPDSMNTEVTIQYKKYKIQKKKLMSNAFPRNVNFYARAQPRRK